MAEYIWIIWLIASIVFFIGEIMTEGFCLFWFSVASLVALFLSLITDNIIIQAGVFFVVAITLLLSTKNLTEKFMRSRPKVESNIDALIGKKAKVIETLNSIEGSGKVKINGDIWKAIPENDNDTFEVGEQVIVKKIDGVKLIISKIL